MALDRELLASSPEYRVAVGGRVADGWSRPRPVLGAQTSDERV